MKCLHTLPNGHTCGAWSTVKETRGTKRRRVCANGHLFNTFEVHEFEAKSLEKRRANLMRGGAAAYAATRTKPEVKAHILIMLRTGDPHTTIAKIIGVSTKTIQKVKREHLAACEAGKNAVQG